jgi:hypothetical protein
LRAANGGIILAPLVFTSIPCFSRRSAMMTRMVLSLVLAGFLGGSLAMAEEAPKKKAAPKRATAEQRFTRLDADGDGKLTLTELTARRTTDESKARVEKLFKEADKGTKGYLTLDEFKTIFDKLDPAPKTKRVPVEEIEKKSTDKKPADKPVDKKTEMK